MLFRSINVGHKPIEAAANVKFDDVLKCKDFQGVISASCLQPDWSMCFCIYECINCAYYVYMYAL